MLEKQEKKRVLIGFSGNPEFSMKLRWDQFSAWKKNLATEADYGIGGTSVDWMFALKALNAPVHSMLMMTVGQDHGDPLRHMLTHRLEREGFDFHVFPVLETTNVGVTLKFTDTEETRIAGYKGPYVRQPLDEVRDHVTAFKPDYCIVTGVQVADLKMAEALYEFDAYRILNPRAEALSHPDARTLLERTNLLIINDAEMSVLLKVDYPTKPSKDIMKRILNFGPKEVIVTCGIKGSYYADQSGSNIHQPVVRNEKATDATGVGDCFAAAYFTRLTEGATVEDRLYFAACAASLKVALPSGSNVPTRGVVDQLVAIRTVPKRD